MKQYPMTLIGIDCACQPENVGLARAEWDGISQARITDVVCCRKAEDIVDRQAAG